VAAYHSKTATVPDKEKYEILYLVKGAYVPQRRKPLLLKIN